MPLHIHNAEIRQDSRIILFQESNPEDQHSRRMLGTLSWVYKPSNILMVVRGSNPCWSYRLQNLRPTKTIGVEMHIPQLLHMMRHPTKSEVSMAVPARMPPMPQPRLPSRTPPNQPPKILMRKPHQTLLIMSKLTNRQAKYG